MTTARSFFCALCLLFIPAAAFSYGEESGRGARGAVCDSLNSSSTFPTSDGEDTLTACTPVADSLLPWPANVQARLEMLTADSMFRLSQLGLCVYDLTADSLLFEHGADQLLRPASCQKVLTAVAALARLGASYRFETALYHTGSVKNDTLRGDLYVVGGFDPAFGGDDMRSFVRSLAERGIKAVDGRIFADLSFKDTLQWGKGWCWDDRMERLTPLPYHKKDIFMKRFLAELRNAGIATDSTFLHARCSQTADTECLVRRHHTIDQILQPMLKESDNFYAEAMYYQLGAGKAFAGGSESGRRVSELVAAAGGDASRCRVADGSGLSLYNYTTPRILVSVLRYAYLRNNIYLHLYPALPVAGIDGTLRQRMRRGPALNNVHAKTGTVTGVSTLAGYLTSAEGHLLCFAIMNQGIVHTANAHRFQDRVCRALCEP